MQKNMEVEESAMPETRMEIERKFLIDRPDPAWLAAWPGSREAEIVQIYLTAQPGEEVRVRHWSEGGRSLYYHTTKRSVSAVSREEIERIVTPEEYEAFLSQADPAKVPLHKKRWLLPYRGQLLEIDLYPFWQDQAILEIELDAEDTPIDLPPQIKVRKEVTDDESYKNAALADRR